MDGGTCARKPGEAGVERTGGGVRGEKGERAGGGVAGTELLGSLATTR